MTYNTKRIFATFFAAVMIVSMLAPTAGAAAAMGSTSGDAIDVDTSDIQTDAQFDADEITATDEKADRSDDAGSDELRVHQESDEVDTGVHPALEDATGETVVIIAVERNVRSVSATNVDSAVDELRADMEETQGPVIDVLEASDVDADVRNQFWAGNVISAEVDLDAVSAERIAEIDGVTRVSPNVEYERPAPQMDGAEPDLDGDFTFGLEQINIPEFDENFDGQGEGASIMIGDDGISNPDEGHPDLEFAEEVNVVNGEINPGLGDPGAHGEHVAGTATAAADPVGEVPRYGVAPNADLLKANVFQGGAFTEDIIASMEWAAENDADVASFSLGFAPDEGLSTFAPAYVETIEDVNAAGTAAVVSAGNSGAGPVGGPVTAPATNFDSVAVGASNEAGDITTFSSGAVIDDRSVEFVGEGDSLPETFPRQYVQPDVSAPGENVLSAGPLGGDIGDPAATYSYASGTSMAAPHYAGAVGLLQSVTDEQLEPEAIENALAETAEKPDNDFPELNSRDIRYGTGIIDVNAAAEALTGDDVQTIEGTVTDAETGEPIVGATVESAEGALTSTDEDGEYTLTVTSDPAEITADDFGFTAETVEVSGGAETDFALEPTLDVALVEDQPAFVTPGDEFGIVVDVRNLESLTLDITDDSTTDPEDVTVSLGDTEVPFGETLEFDSLDQDGVTLDVAVDEDAELDSEFAIEHTFSGEEEEEEPPAEDTVAFGDGEFVFAPGQTDNVTMDTSADDVAGYEVFVDFDPEVIQIESIEAVDLDGPLSTNIDNENGTFAAAQAQANGVDAPDMLDVEITFVGETGDTTDLAFDEDESAVFASDGGIDVDFEDATLTAGQLGDVNNDGEITAFDAILIQQYIAGQEPQDDFYPALADVTQDGYVHTGDVIALLDMIVGADNEHDSVEDVLAAMESIEASGDDASVAAGHEIVVVTGPTEVVDEIPDPEFEISNLEQAEELELDDTIVGSADVTNVGEIGAQLEVLYHLRDDLDGDTIISIGPQIVDLEPGETETVTDSLLTIEDINAAIPDADYGPGDDVPFGFQVAADTPDFDPIDDELQNITFVEESVDGFAVSDLDAPGQAEPGEEIDVSATITNTADETDTQTVEFVFEGDVAAEQELTLDAEQNETVEFTDVPLPEEAGEYEHGVFTEDDSQTAIIEVGEVGEAAFELTDLDQPDSIAMDEDIISSVEVTNVGDAAGETDVLHILRDDFDGDGIETIISIGPQTVDLEPGESAVVEDNLGTFEEINDAPLDVPDFEPGDVVPTGFQAGDDLPGFDEEDLEDEVLEDLTIAGAGFEVSDLDAPGEADPGAEIDVSATITNLDTETDTQTVEFVFEGDVAAEQEVTLDPEEAETVEFTNIPLPDEAGVYEHGVSTEDDSQMATIQVGDVEFTSVAVVDEGNFEGDERERLEGDEVSADTGGDLVDRLEGQLGDGFDIDGLSGEEAVDAAENGDYDVYAVNQINEEFVEDFDAYTADGSVGVVWLDQWGGSSNGVADKSEVLNNPEEANQGLGDEPTLNILADHPIFDGIEEESFLIHTVGLGDYTTFDGYNGEVVGEVEGGDAIAADEEKGTILLSSFGSSAFITGDDYTEEADIVVGNAVEYLAGDDEDGEATFEVVDVDPSSDLEVDPGAELEINATVENTGDETNTQEVEFVFAGDTLASETVELEAGDEATVTFDITAPDEEGEYDWYVATDDDQSDTWTLTVSAEESPDATTVAIVDGDLDTETLRLELEERGFSDEEIEATLAEFDPDEMNEFSQTVRDGLDDDQYEVVDVSSEDLLDNTDYDVYVVSQFEEESDIIEFQDEIDDDTGVVYADGWSSNSVNSLNALVDEIGDPAETDSSFSGTGDVVLELTDDHPLFDGVGEAGDVITHLDGVEGSQDRRWFSDYSGEVVADVGLDGDEVDGAGIGVSDDGSEVILASHARWSSSFTPDEAFTEESNQIVFNAIEYVASDDGDSVDSDDDVESMTATPLAA